MSIIIVSMAPMGVVPLRMSKLDGEPPKMIGAPGAGGLADDQPGQVLGDVLDEGPGDRGRARSPRSCPWR